MTPAPGNPEALPVEILASPHPLQLLDVPATGRPEALPDDPEP